MRKLIYIIPGMLILLTACNFPLTKPTQQINLIATSVALTMNALPSNTLPPTQNIPPTIELTTPPATGTPTITPTPTTPPGDPVLTLGKPDFSDSLVSGSAFGLRGKTYEDDAVKISVSNGAMNFVSKTINGGNRWRLAAPQPRNFYLEGTFTTVQCSGYDHFGLVMRMPSYTDGIGYYFAVSCNGKFTFESWDGSVTNDIVIWTSDSSIKSGSNQTNRIGVMAKDDNFKLYINGILAKEFTDKGFPAKGHFGAYTSALDNPGFSVNLEEIREWNLP
jgi:hypothetical protein